MRAAFTAFEEAQLPRLKQENPNMRLSQLKQLLKKEWLRSPDNPMNQRCAAFNAPKCPGPGPRTAGRRPPAPRAPRPQPSRAAMEGPCPGLSTQ